MVLAKPSASRATAPKTQKGAVPPSPVLHGVNGHPQIERAGTDPRRFSEYDARGRRLELVRRIAHGCRRQKRCLCRERRGQCVSGERAPPLRRAEIESARARALRTVLSKDIWRKGEDPPTMPARFIGRYWPVQVM